MTRHACVVGSGAREHALALALSRTADVSVAPGSAAMRGSRITPTGTTVLEIDADLYVVGPEQPLVDGLADELRARGKLVVGPGHDGARLEGSKSFMKGVLMAAGVPTARYGTFERVDEAVAFLRELGGTVVVKTDGLAAGKGVFVTDDLDAAAADVAAKLSGATFGEAGRRVVVEEGLAGTECSLLVLVDGTSAVPLAPARDYKRLGDADQGPNTGGMGAVSPPEGVDDVLVAAVMGEAVEPTLKELAARGIDYRGVLYAGLMVEDGRAKVLEYNVRLGDPEAEVVLPRLADDPFDLFEATASGTLAGAPRFISDAAVTVVLAAAGYPGTVTTGAVIRGLDDDGQLAEHRDGVVVFHGATRKERDHYVVAGGRVLAVTALAPTIAAARTRAYEAVDQLSFEGCQVRRDVAWDAGAPT
ncbi:MAG TPA: phosphoribosylamine--glycine ligase [Acidimicrobiales bacterium]|nr:phosphoribosylamine--glycine ligase [Acidimicrobiales bacterium]